MKALIKDKPVDRTNMERQLLNVTKVLDKDPYIPLQGKHHTGIDFTKPTLMTHKTVIIYSN